MIDRSKAPQVHTLQKLQLPAPSQLTLDNGVMLKYYNGGSQDVVQLDLVWRGGKHEAPSQPVATLMATLMREGTAHHSSDEISELMDFNGAMLKINTSQHFTILSVTCLSSKICDVLPMVREIVCEPVFDEEMLQKFRDIETQNLLLSLSRVSTLSSDALKALLFGPGHPEAYVPTPEAIQAVASADLKSWHEKVILSGRCTAYLSGRISDETLRDVTDMLAQLPAHEPLKLAVMTPHPLDPETVTVDKPGAVQASVSLGIPAIGRSHPDYVPLRFTVMALGGYFGSRLMKNIREDKGYTYGIMSFLAGDIDGSNILIMAQADKRYVEPLIAEVRAELLRLASEPLDDAELMRLRQYISTSLMENLDSPFAIMDYYKTIEIVGIPEGYFDSQVDMAMNLEPGIIIDMARKYLDPDKLRIAICK